MTAPKAGCHSRRPLRIAVIGGGFSGEHEVSLASAAAAGAALEQRGHTCERFILGRDGSWWHGDDRLDVSGAVTLLAGCDAALPLVHGPRGEDGSLAALCGFAGVPVVGSGVMAGAIGMDKWAAKMVAESMGVATTPGVLLRHGHDDPGPWNGPLVVKPVAAGSSIGVRLVSEPAELADAIAAARAISDRVIVEQAVDGREIDIAILRRGDGLVVSAPLEITTDGFFDYAAKYDHGATFQVPAELTADQLGALTLAAMDVFEAIGCDGVARVDFFLTRLGWLFNEINTVPGMTSASQVPLMFDAIGLPYPELMDGLVREAVARHLVWADAG